MGCFYSQATTADDWKPEWTEAHAGWLTYKTNMLVIFYAPDSVLARNNAIRAFAGKRIESYDNDLKALGLKDERTIKMFVYDSNEVAQKVIRQNAGFAQSTVGIIHTKVDQTPGHELTHVLSRAINGRPPPNRLLDEGLAVWMNNSGRDHFAEGRRLLVAKQLPAASQIIEMLDNRDESCYPAAGAYVGFLLTKYGADKFKQLWGARKESYEEQFQVVYEKSLSDMDAEWRIFLTAYNESRKEPAPFSRGRR